MPNKYYLVESGALEHRKYPLKCILSNRFQVFTFVLIPAGS